MNTHRFWLFVALVALLARDTVYPHAPEGAELSPCGTRLHVRWSRGVAYVQLPEATATVLRMVGRRTVARQ